MADIFVVLVGGVGGGPQAPSNANNTLVRAIIRAGPAHGGATVFNDARSPAVNVTVNFDPCPA